MPAGAERALPVVLQCREPRTINLEVILG